MVSNKSLRYDGRVAIVTGAGGGLGREYALELARRGAAVVVNDLGGGRFGDTDGSSRPADTVVEQIRNAGGKAVPNYDSVADGQRIVDAAVKAFGRIDIVVNNAGILRDKSFANMTDKDWDLIFEVHVRGAYAVTKAAWPHMRKQKYGRVVMTSSNSGIYGSFGQANYSAAKMALIGFASSLSLEGRKYNINVNALVPTAGSRLTQTIMPDELIEALKPAYVMPLTLWLCHENCETTGRVLEGGAGWFGQLRWYRSKGKVLNAEHMTVEDVRDNWDQITDMNDAKAFNSSAEITGELLNVLSKVNESSPKMQMAPAATSMTSVRGTRLPDAHFEYTTKDAIIYALAIGCSPGRRASDLNYTYESAADFGVFPLFCVAPGLTACMSLASVVPGVQPTRVLHGEQYLEFHSPWPADGGKTRSTATIVDVLDKGSGALILCDVDTFDAVTGTKLASGQYATFLVGGGKFGGPRTSPHEKASVPVPKRKPDATFEESTCVDQAAVYRQGGGDMNPLHIDKDVAKVLGFDRPILHGLCSLGFAVRHVLLTYADNDGTQLRDVKVRFAKPVMPGQTLVTEMWRSADAPTRVHFQTKVKETGQVALSAGYVDLKMAAASKVEKPSAPAGGGDDELQSTAVFDVMKERVEADGKNLVKKVKGVFVWVITKGGKEAGVFTVDLKNGAGEVYAGRPKGAAKADTTLTLADDDMVKLVGGQLNAQQAFMSGKLKIKGNLMLTQKLQTLFNAEKAKL